ncbi:hypothetical protein VitviT2T_008511 [Vitis vinifera]|uniref:KN homeodomain domain-containing protein n=1 Tax=Vitis vinifera TaxID=29760 RepID=A0ABY9C2P4_VITVI|nr:hypothetical protein VitviT2T_008511 [Vitis vinifera]
MQSLFRFKKREEALGSKILQETAKGLEYLACDMWTSSSCNRVLFSSLHFLHPCPKDSDKIMLARQMSLTRRQVSNSFINARVRLWKPMGAPTPEF